MARATRSKKGGKGPGAAAEAEPAQQAVVDLQAQEPASSELHINIVTLTGAKFTVICSAEHSLKDLKDAIETKTGVPVAKQRLLYSGRELQNASRTMRQLHIGAHENYNVHLVSAHPVTMDNTDPVSLLSSAAATAPQEVVIDGNDEKKETADACLVIDLTVPDGTTAAPAAPATRKSSRKRQASTLDAEVASSTITTTTTAAAVAASSFSASSSSFSSSSSSASRSNTASTVAAVTDPPAAPPSSQKKQTKRQRQAAAGEGDDQAVEKRAARYRSSAPQGVVDRIRRAVTQRLYLMDEKDNSTPGALARVYTVLGSTGNVYDVTVQKFPNCTCPDAQRGNLCKHILFVFLKVLRLDRHSPLIFQKALLQSELQDMFETADRHAAQRAAVMASENTIRAYKASMGEQEDGEEKGKEEEGAAAAPVQIEEGTECPICYEDIKPDGSEPLDQCQTCRNFVHKDCFLRWSQQSRQKGLQITCVFCRSEWKVDSAGGKDPKSRIGREGYLNFADEQGMSGRRQYEGHWWQRRFGHRYRYEDDSGEQDYDDDLGIY